jgi:hypothetical protein
MPPHIWKFFRAGGFDQVQLATGADLMHLDELDFKLWVALSCPATGLEFSAETAAQIDSDGDGRIRAPELIAAVKWAGSMLKDPDELIRRGDVLRFDAIADASLLASARQICANAGKPEAAAISLADVDDAERLFAESQWNGDGVVPVESAPDEATRAALADIAACVGTVPDRSGKPGIDQARMDAFFTACGEFDAWQQRARADAANVLPLGEATAAAFAAVRAIRPKVHDFFGRCRLAAYDARAVVALNRREEEYLEIAARDMSISADEVAGFPLAQVGPARPLPLKNGVNPAHAAAIATLRSDAVQPLLGDREELTESDWRSLLAKLAPHEAWQAASSGAAVESLGASRVRELLAGGARDAVAALIAQDLTREPEGRAIGDVRRLLLYKRDLHLLCTNFVNFRDFYDAGEPSIFQAGTLYLDQRSCTLTLSVQDAGRHAAMAALAGSYLAYCDCVRKRGGERRQIVAAFTNGDSDNLMVGRNGVFIDRSGADWDATITRIVDNPISVRQAFWAPYKKLLRLVEEQVAKRAATRESESHARLETTAKSVPGASAAPPPPEPKKVDVGVVAAMGVAFGAIATAFAAMAGYLSGLVKLPFWQVCLAVFGLLLLVSGPSMVIAWLKLRKRNLGPILDANGWAVNAKAKLNVPFGTTLTGVATLPKGHVMSTQDRFSERPSPWPKLLMFVVVVGFLYSLLNQFFVLDAIYHTATGRHAPALFTPAPGSGAAPGGPAR